MMLLSRTAWNRPTRSVALALVAAMALIVLTFAPSDTARAADASTFDPGFLISDEVFFKGSAMTRDDIQTFLSDKGRNCVAGAALCLKDIVVDIAAKNGDAYCAAIAPRTGVRAADVISAVAVACNINPQVLIVLLEKEQSLVTTKNPTERMYTAAAGYDCPDTGACNAVSGGLSKQIYNAARQFQKYRANPLGYNHIAGRNNNVLYYPPEQKPQCGSSKVYIKNQATAGLYNYTPYQPNAAALANLYGTGDACSSYGNRNFWRLFTDWFSNPGNLLIASGFEASASHWGFANGALDRLIIGPDSSSNSGQYYLSMYAGTPYRSLSQDVTVNAPAGTGYEGSIWVKSGSQGIPFNGVLAIWGLGAGNEVTTKDFTVGDQWTEVKTTLATTQATRTVRLEVYLKSTDALLSLDTTSLTAVTPKAKGGFAPLTSPSFENGLGTWGFTNGFMNRALYNFGGDAHSGSWILATNTAVANRSLKQDLPYNVMPGETLSATIWMRSDNANINANGTLALWGMGSTVQAGSTRFSVGSNWTPVTAILDATASGLTTLRFEIYLESTDVTLFLDDASITSSLLPNGNFAHGVSAWSTGGTPAALTLVDASSGRTPLTGNNFATTVPTFTGGSFATDLSRKVDAGETYQATIWLRSASTAAPFTGQVALWGLGGTNEVATAPVSVGSAWQPFTVTLPAAQNHTSLRLEVYANSGSMGTDVGVATLVQLP